VITLEVWGAEMSAGI